MENNVNSKTTKTIRRKIDSVYAVPCINEETLTKWDQIFEVYFSEKPFNEAKKIEKLLGKGYTVVFSDIYFIEHIYRDFKV